VYRTVGLNVLNAVMAGRNACFAAYGATGSGKSYTVFGAPLMAQAERSAAAGGATRLPKDGDVPEKEVSTHLMDDSAGVVPRLLHDLLQSVKADRRASSDTATTLRMSLVEVIQDNVYDLCNRRQLLTIRETKNGGFFADGVVKRTVGSDAEAVAVLLDALSRRTIATHDTNPLNSRAHTLVNLELRRWSGDRWRTARVVVADLAGNERVTIAKSEMAKKTFQQATNVNLALLTLGTCVSTLVARLQSGLPAGTITQFRNSALTKLLQDTIVGSGCHLAMICTLAPGAAAAAQSLHTLRFADQVKHHECRHVSFADVRGLGHATKAAGGRLKGGGDADDADGELQEIKQARVSARFRGGRIRRAGLALQVVRRLAAVYGKQEHTMRTALIIEQAQAWHSIMARTAVVFPPRLNVPSHKLPPLPPAAPRNAAAVAPRKQSQSVSILLPLLQPKPPAVAKPLAQRPSVVQVTTTRTVTGANGKTAVTATTAAAQLSKNPALDRVQAALLREKLREVTTRQQHVTQTDEPRERKGVLAQEARLWQRLVSAFKDIRGDLIAAASKASHSGLSWAVKDASPSGSPRGKNPSAAPVEEARQVEAEGAPATPTISSLHSSLHSSLRSSRAATPTTPKVTSTTLLEAEHHAPQGDPAPPSVTASARVSPVPTPEPLNVAPQSLSRRSPSVASSVPRSPTPPAASRSQSPVDSIPPTPPGERALLREEEELLPSVHDAAREPVAHAASVTATEVDDTYADDFDDAPSAMSIAMTVDNATLRAQLEREAAEQAAADEARRSAAPQRDARDEVLPVAPVDGTEAVAEAAELVVSIETAAAVAKLAATLQDLSGVSLALVVLDSAACDTVRSAMGVAFQGDPEFTDPLAAMLRALHMARRSNGGAVSDIPLADWCIADEWFDAPMCAERCLAEPRPLLALLELLAARCESDVHRCVTTDWVLRLLRRAVAAPDTSIATSIAASPSLSSGVIAACLFPVGDTEVASSWRAAIATSAKATPHDMSPACAICQSCAVLVRRGYEGSLRDELKEAGHPAFDV
jgi:hypothetical protein